MSYFNGLIRDSVVKVLGTSIAEPQLMDLGNPITGEVDISLDNAEHPGLVWVHAHRGNNQVISGAPELATDDKSTATRALCKPTTVPDDLRIYGLPVFVKVVNGVLEVIDLGGLPAVEYIYGLRNHPQRSIDITQFDYGLIRPTSPPSRRVIISGFRPTLDGVAYDVPALLSSDLITAYYTGMGAGQARAVKIEVDPQTKTVYYQAGSFFPNTTHEKAFSSYYPKTVTAGRFLYGWVKLYEDIEVIDITDIYAAQEVYSKYSTGGTQTLQVIMTLAGEILTDSTGEVMWSTEDY